jgi:hypothetical protein
VLEIAVLTGALVTIPLTVALEEHPGLSWIQIADWAVWSIFVLELPLASRQLAHAGNTFAGTP